MRGGRWVSRVGGCLAAAVVTAAGVVSLGLDRESPTFSFARGSVALEALALVTGLSLLAASAAVCRSRSDLRGLLLGAVAVAWFVVQWNNPGAGSLVFSTGLLLGSAVTAVVTHAALRTPTPPRGAERIVVVAGYLCTIGVGGLLPAVFFDPARAGCDCPRNLLLLHGDTNLSVSLTRVATWSALGWLVVAAGAVVVRTLRAPAPSRRLDAPFHAVAAGVLLVVLLDYAHSARRGFLALDGVDRTLWTAQAWLLLALAASTRWPSVRTALARAAVARLLVTAADAPAPGQLGRALGRALGDTSVRILYPVSSGLVDSVGDPAAVNPSRDVTRLVQGGMTVAILEHRRETLAATDDATRVVEIARLAVLHDRLRAERQSQLADLRLSRARVVEAADEERRRLERDLHDGAQQRLVVLSLAVQLAALQSDCPPASSRLDRAGDVLRSAMADLRRVARGLYPRELVDEGLAAALDVLAESGPRRVDVSCEIGERPPPPIEAAAYFAVARLAGSAGDVVRVHAERRDDLLSLQIDVRRPPADLVDVDDHVGALAGTVEIVSLPGSDAGARVLVELPCGS